MAIKTSTQEMIAARLGNPADWQVFGVYEYAWQCRNCACGHPIATSFVLIRKGDHGPGFGDQVELGSECIKFIKSLSPDLFTWLMTAKAEMERIQRRVKREREDEFHATPEWRALSARINAIVPILRASRSGWGLPLLTTLGVELGRYTAHDSHEILLRQQRGNRFQFVEDTIRFTVRCEAQATKVVEETRPFQAVITAKLATLRSGYPNYSELKAISDRLAAE